MKGIALATLVALSLSSVSFADDLDDLMGGFDESEIDTTVADIKLEEDSWFSFSGDNTFSSAYNYQDAAQVKGLSRLRNTLNIYFDMQLSKNWKSKIEMKTLYDPVYDIQNINTYTPTLQTENEFKEAYIQGTVGKWDMKFGRQITVWGKSDNIRITDVINPLDNREIGMVDIKDLRLPISTSKFSYFTGDYGFNLSIIHEARIQKEAAIGGEFFPSDLFGNFVVPGVLEPKSSVENTQVALSIDGTFSGWDMSLYAARILDKQWHIENFGTPAISREYSLINMTGFALNAVSGAWLFKTETAFFDALKYNTTQDEKQRLDVLLGVEYNGIKDITTSFEVANRHVFDYEAQMIGAADYTRQNEMTTAWRTSYTFDHDNATFTYLVTMLGYELQDGGFQRAWLDYDFSDTVQLTVGVIDYLSGDKPYFEAIAVNDRIFFDIKYSF